MKSFENWRELPQEEVYYKNNKSVDNVKRMPQPLPKLTEGAKKCVITNVVDDEAHSRLEVWFDIVDDFTEENKLKDYFAKKTGEQRKLGKLKLNDWFIKGKLNAWYSDVKSWKAFVTCVERSNKAWLWDNENPNIEEFLGKYVVVVFKNEPFKASNGRTYQSATTKQFRSLEAYEKGEIESTPKVDIDLGGVVEKDPFEDVQSLYNFDDINF